MSAPPYEPTWTDRGQGLRRWCVYDQREGFQPAWADLEEWDAIALGRWRRFEKWARAAADHVPSEMLTLLAINQYDAHLREQEEHAAMLDKWADVAGLAVTT